MKLLSVILLFSPLLVICINVMNPPNSPIRTRFSSISHESGEALTLIYKLTMPANRIGNFLGFYFEALACADIIGMIANVAGVSGEQINNL